MATETEMAGWVALLDAMDARDVAGEAVSILQSPARVARELGQEHYNRVANGDAALLAKARALAKAADADFRGLRQSAGEVDYDALAAVRPDTAQDVIAARAVAAARTLLAEVA